MTTHDQPTVSVIESITSVDRVLKNTKLLMVDSEKMTDETPCTGVNPMSGHVQEPQQVR